MKTHTTREAALAPPNRQTAGAKQTAPLRPSPLGTMANTSTSAAALQRFQQLANNSPRIMQLQERAALMASTTSATAMRAMQMHMNAPVQREAKPDGNGLPTPLKSGIESLSGMSMDHVKVRYNSDKPGQLQAHAYAQGSEIHLAPGQERHLPHEAWHVVQQAQGRVRPTMQMKPGVAVNDDAGLEREADVMGARAMQAGSDPLQRVRASRDAREPGLASANGSVLQPVWVRAENGEVSWIETDDLSGFDVTGEMHAEAQGHPHGSVHVKKHAGLQATALPSMTGELDVPDAAQKLASVIASDASLCYRFLLLLDTATLWAYARTSRVSLAMTQRFVATYFPRYEDRFIFNLATRGLLLHTRPTEKYGGKVEKPFYPEHATSGFKWYSAALHGNGVMVLGDLKDYKLMRDYDSLFHSKEQAQSVEQNAKYLMAWPWSLLVNSALVTGAIHGGRQVVGASPITAASVYKKPDNKDTFGMTVYAREMMQLILKHKYSIKTQTDPHEARGLDYPDPADGGGFLLTPTLDPRRHPSAKAPYATIFDVGPADEQQFGNADQADDLVSALNPPAYRAISFDGKKKQAVSDGAKEEKKKYDTLRIDMKRTRQRFDDLGRPGPPKLAAMFAEIYPGGPAALASIPRWKRVEYDHYLQYLAQAGDQYTLDEAAASNDPDVSRYYDLVTRKSLTSMQDQEEGNFDEWADDDEYFAGGDLADWRRLTAQFGPIWF
ncbi:eCIS core domain-containing protein [Massilia frigida]|uniref:eCIS core domain-containing protein n=1 Tax=Massilia frigida TaxID=2609281 RepID=UPI001E360794|nr:DUF4157 domain-containing protein [Massilia frigida]